MMYPYHNEFDCGTNLSARIIFNLKTFANEFLLEILLYNCIIKREKNKYREDWPDFTKVAKCKPCITLIEV